MDRYKRIVEALGSYKIEVGLLATAALIATVSFFLIQTKDVPAKETVSLKNIEIGTTDELVIDIGGAVSKPGVYAMRDGARVRDALSKAGGFAKDADVRYVSKTLNQARALSDQEKIYIPTREDSVTEVFATSLSAQNHDNLTDLVNINSASEEELDSLPGVGPSTISKILNNRPYDSPVDLIDKKIVGPAVFENIQPLITTLN